MSSIAYHSAQAADFARLLALRLAAMRPGLEAIGRFETARSTERFRGSFDAAITTLMIDGDTLVGFYAVTRHADHLHLVHLYVDPPAQSRGLGRAALQRVIGESESLALPIRLGALRASRANAFYLRHGFRATHEDARDIHYERQPTAH